MRSGEQTNRVSLSYAPNVNNKLKSSFRRKIMEMVYKTQNTLPIYEVTCEVCKAKCFAQTRRKVMIRYNEHLAAIMKKKPSESAVAIRFLDKKHFNFPPSNIKLMKIINNPMYPDAYGSYYIHRN